MDFRPPRTAAPVCGSLIVCLCKCECVWTTHSPHIGIYNSSSWKLNYTCAVFCTQTPLLTSLSLGHSLYLLCVSVSLGLSGTCRPCLVDCRSSKEWGRSRNHVHPKLPGACRPVHEKRWLQTANDTQLATGRCVPPPFSCLWERFWPFL